MIHLYNYRPARAPTFRLLLRFVIIPSASNYEKYPRVDLCSLLFLCKQLLRDFVHHEDKQAP